MFCPRCGELTDLVEESMVKQVFVCRECEMTITCEEGI